MTCPFCDMPPERVIAGNAAAFAVRDLYPVTEGHMLVIPRRHVADYFDLTDDELLACHSLLHESQAGLLLADSAIQGFNIGVNVGEVAGQTIYHCHIHLIPRRAGDVENPRGGVRHTIPGKGNY